MPTPVVAFLARVPLFAGAPPEDLECLTAAGHLVHLGPGEAVEPPAALGGCLYVVLEGCLRASEVAAHDGDAGGSASPLGPGAWFGELTLLDGGPPDPLVSSITTCSLFALTRRELIETLKQSPGLLGIVLAHAGRASGLASQQLVWDGLSERTVRAERELERHRSLARLAAGAAHEINTPLSIAATAAELIEQHVSSDELNVLALSDGTRAALEDLRHATELLGRSVARAHRLAQDFKRLSVGQVAEDCERAVLADVVNDTVWMFGINARRSKLDVRVHNQLRPDEGVWIGHPGYLGQVVLNLLTNVERYAYPDGQGGRVDVTLAEEARWPGTPYTIEVRDYGRGIPEDVLPRIFEPFFTTGRSVGGTGLGLSIVQTLVTTALGGHVQVTSSPGEGTTALLRLPRVVPAGSDSLPGPEIRSAVRSSADDATAARGYAPYRP